MRQLLIGSFLEPIAFTLREHLELTKTKLLKPTEFADVYNNQLARKLMLAIIETGDVFLDIGAHIGSITSGALRAGARVIAFEAIPEKADRLRAKFPKAVIHGCALAEQEGSAVFNIDLQASGNSSMADLGGAVRQITVQTARLDDLVPEENPTVIKLDVEGAELGVLLGGDAVVTRSHPTIMFESSPEERLGYTKRAIWDWLNDRGYRIFSPDRVAHTGAAMSFEVFSDSHSYPRRTTNYFAVHSTRLATIRRRALLMMGLVGADGLEPPTLSV